MKKIISFTYCLFYVLYASAQITNNGANIHLSSGTTLITELSIQNTNSGTIDNSGTIIADDFTTETGAETKGSGIYEISGDWTNSATFTANNSRVVLDAGTSSNITSGGNAFYDLDINKTNGEDISLLDDMSIGNSLNFTADNNKANIGNHQLSVAATASLTGYDANDYVLTNGSGSLSKQQLSGSFTFPVGNDHTSYNPLTITQTGTTDDMNVRVLADVLMDGYTGTIIPENVVAATWEIAESTPGGSNLALTAQWSAGDELVGFDRSAASIHQYISPDWVPSTFGPASGSDPYSLTNSGFTSTGLFSVSNPGALPVELLSFDGMVGEKRNHLSWKTASETNSSHFEVESSTDGTSFRKIGEVAAKGNTGEQTSYVFDDLNPSMITYYRLRIVDLDRSYEFSPTIILQRGKSPMAAFELFPNPARRMIRITTFASHDSDIRIDIIDAIGRILKTVTKQSDAIGEFNASLDISAFPAGIYHARLTNGDEVSVLPFVIR